MKKVLLFTLAAAMTVGTIAGVGAQEKGKFWVGGKFGFGSTDYTVATVNSFTVAPEFGYNFSDRWGAGIEFSVMNSAIHTEQDTQHSYAKTLSFAPFARYTFARWRALSIHADGGFAYMYADGNIDDSGNYSGNETQSGGIFVNPGFTLHVTRCLALTGRVNLFSLSTSTTSANYTSTGSDSYDVTSWAASLNSPFASGAIQLGFHVSF